jgi:hypothetical protein
LVQPGHNRSLCTTYSFNTLDSGLLPATLAREIRKTKTMGQWCTLQIVIIWATFWQSPYNYRKNQWLPKAPPIDALSHVSGEVSPTFTTIGHVKNNFTTPLDNLAWQQAQPHVLDLKWASHERTTIGCLAHFVRKCYPSACIICFEVMLQSSSRALLMSYLLTENGQWKKIVLRKHGSWVSPLPTENEWCKKSSHKSMFVR